MEVVVGVGGNRGFEDSRIRGFEDNQVSYCCVCIDRCSQRLEFINKN